MNKKVIWFLIISIVIFSSCNLSVFTKKTVDHSIGNKEGVESSSKFDTATPVEGVRAFIALDENKIKISWNKKSGANRYYIERATYPSAIRPDISTDEKKEAFINSLTFTRLPNEVDDTYFIDEISTSSSRRKDVYYVYRVYAASIVDDTENVVSDIVLGSYLSSPLDATASKGKDESKITIEFTQTPGTSKYMLYKNTINAFSGNLESIQTKQQVNTLPDGKNSFEYTVSEDEKGKELYFAIKSVASNNVQTDFSTSTKGYTKIQGAPNAPTVSTTKGESKDFIRIKFTVENDDGSLTFQIMKSKNGGGETVLLDTSEDPSSLLTDESGAYYYDDDNVQANTSYSYSVIAKNSLGIGPAGKDETGDAYILSPPYSITAKPITTAIKFGYELNVESPLGYDKNTDLVYVVKSTYKNGQSDETTFEHNNFEKFYNVNRTAETDDEIREIEVRVKNTKTNETSSSVKAYITGIPQKVSSFKASQNVYDASIGAKDGVYPVILEWQGRSTPKYRIERYNEGTTDGLYTITTTDVRYNDKTVALGQKYDYRIYAEDALGRSNGYEESKSAYGAITPALFAAEFERHCAKPWEFQEYHPDYAHTAAKGGIWGLIRNEGTGSLGSASATDDYLHGTVAYSAKMSGFGGQLKFTYTPGFGEMPYIHFFTEEESTDVAITTPQGYDSWVGMSGDGDYTPWNNQRFYVSGWYGKNIIDATGITTKSKKLSGVYRVTMTYNTREGGTTTVEGVATPLSRGKVS